MAPEPAPKRPLIKKGPLKPPQPRLAATSYTEPPRAKNETFVALPGSKPGMIVFEMHMHVSSNMFAHSCVQRGFLEQASPAVRQSRGRLRSSPDRKIMTRTLVTSETSFTCFRTHVALRLRWFQRPFRPNTSRLPPTGGEPAAPKSSSGEIFFRMPGMLLVGHNFFPATPQLTAWHALNTRLPIAPSAS